jgi:hypothetical protein
MVETLRPQGIGNLGDRYILMERIGFGASCKVFSAFDTQTKTFVAVKVPRAECSDDDFLSLTKAEVEGLSSCTH